MSESVYEHHTAISGKKALPFTLTKNTGMTASICNWHDNIEILYITGGDGFVRYGGVICASGVWPVHRAVYDVDPDLISDAVNENDEPEKADFCSHWPNYLRLHPEHNFERLPKLVKYFSRQAEIFGLMLAKDTGFAKISFEESKCIIDFTEADNKGAIGLKNEFYISFKMKLLQKIVLTENLSFIRLKKILKPIKSQEITQKI